MQAWDSISETVEFTAPVDTVRISQLLDPQARILDLSCGYGRVTAQLSLQGFANVIGYDASQRMIERGRLEYPDLKLEVANAHAIPESDESFEAVVIAALLTSEPERHRRSAIISEIARLLAPDGLVIGVDFLVNDNVQYNGNGHFAGPEGIEMKHFSEQELAEEFSQFKNWECKKVPAKTISGSSISALQYAARQPANKGFNRTPESSGPARPGELGGGAG